MAVADAGSAELIAHYHLCEILREITPEPHDRDILGQIAKIAVAAVQAGQQYRWHVRGGRHRGESAHQIDAADSVHDRGCHQHVWLHAERQFEGFEWRPGGDDAVAAGPKFPVHQETNDGRLGDQQDFDIRLHHFAHVKATLDRQGTDQLSQLFFVGVDAAPDDELKRIQKLLGVMQFVW